MAANDCGLGCGLTRDPDTGEIVALTDQITVLCDPADGKLKAGLAPLHTAFGDMPGVSDADMFGDDLTSNYMRIDTATGIIGPSSITNPWNAPSLLTINAQGNLQMAFQHVGTGNGYEAHSCNLGLECDPLGGTSYQVCHSENSVWDPAKTPFQNVQQFTLQHTVRVTIPALATVTPSWRVMFGNFAPETTVPNRVTMQFFRFQWQLHNS